MRAIFRVLGAAMLALALILLVADGTAMLAANGYVATPLAATISSLLPGTLESIQIALQQNIHPIFWDPTLTTLLSWPGWAVIGLIGVLLAMLGRSQARRQLVTIDQF